MPDWAITPGSSLALIGNAAAQTFGQSGPLIRGVFDRGRWRLRRTRGTRLEPIMELLHPQAETC